ncbi:hypothetical protein AC249_AIPGENE10670 [Exaiptasia diaphana]|nr:hypothetical protein AC249_AIPGENE10670 [Exaiptasia diaphana]
MHFPNSGFFYTMLLIFPLVPPRWEVIFDFEKGSASLSQWKQTGTAFKNQPTYGDNPTARNRPEPSNHQGDFWIGGAENRPNKTYKAGQVQGDGPKGTLTSPSFYLNGNKLRFLIGGGCDIKIERVELIVDGRAVKSATGKCKESMDVHEWTVSCFTGKEARIRLVDSSSGNWAHINFDQLEIWTDKKHLSDWCPLFDFEKGRASMADWTLTGTVFNNQPTYGDNPTARNRGEPSNHKGDWWIGGSENRPNKTSKAGEIQGDEPFGNATSPTFVIKGNKLRFLIGGGCDINFERVELLVDAVVVKKATGKCTESMAVQEWDVGAYKGKKAQVRLVDKYMESNIWSHINCDQFEVYQ